MQFLNDYGILGFAPLITVGLLFVLFITEVYIKEIILTTELSILLLCFNLINKGLLLEAIYSSIVTNIILVGYAILRRR